MKEVGNRFRLVVYDEAHRLPAPALRESALDCLAPLMPRLEAFRSGSSRRQPAAPSPRRVHDGGRRPRAEC